MKFSGASYDPQYDETRLTKQHGRVWSALQGGGWMTLTEIARVTADPESSISAQLRNLRKERFGGHTILRRRRGHPPEGVHEYQLQPSEEEMHDEATL